MIISLIITAIGFLSGLLLAAAISAAHWWSVAGIVATDAVLSVFAAWWCVFRTAMLERRAAAEAAEAAADAAALAECRRTTREWLERRCGADFANVNDGERRYRAMAAKGRNF